MSVHRYSVALDPRRHQLAVELVLEDVPEGVLRLAVPTWVPGAYAFLRLGRALFDLRAEDAAGRRLAVRRAGWSGWQVEGASGRVRIQARATALDPEWGELTGLVDEDQAVLLATLYPFAPELPGPCEVRYEVPEGWGFHHPAGAERLGRCTFLYDTHARLVDTPVVLGRFDVLTRAVQGVPFHHVFLSRPLGWEEEAERFVADLSRVAEACHTVFGGFPFESYTFVFDANPLSHWGLEHATSTMIGLSEGVFTEAPARSNGLRVSAHELFHAWNVCRLQPAPLGAVDLVRGAFPDALWVAEGFTRYYEFLLLVRAGLLPPEALVSNLLNYHRQLEAFPAYARVSPEEASRATFLNHHRYPGSAASSLDYYDQGMLVAFELEAVLRGSGDSLDAAFADFYRCYAGRGDGYTGEQLRQFLAARLPAAGEVVARAAFSAGQLGTVEALTRFGFRVEGGPVPRLGLVLEGNAGPRVSAVLDTGPAAEAGLAAGDELLTVEGRPFRLAALSWATERRPEVTVQVRRGARDRTVRIRVRPVDAIRAVRWTGDATRRALLEAWLGVPWTVGEGAVVPLEAHDNFHGIQVVR